MSASNFKRDIHINSLVEIQKLKITLYPVFLYNLEVKQTDGPLEPPFCVDMPWTHPIMPVNLRHKDGKSHVQIISSASSI